MPVYDYECQDCGPFAAMRPMAEYELPMDCPVCGTSAPRAFLTAPRLAVLSSEQRTAHATNERSAHEPLTSGQLADNGKHVCGAGCSHDHGKKTKKSRTVKGADGSKSFPSARPWMISH